jgi:hypothetical protein
MEGAAAGDAMAAAAPGDAGVLPVGAYPVGAAGDMMGYAAAGHAVGGAQHQAVEGVQHDMMAQQEGVDMGVAPGTDVVQQ